MKTENTESQKFHNLGSIVVDVRSLLTNIARLTDGRNTLNKYHTDALKDALPSAMKVAAQALEAVVDALNIESVEHQLAADYSEKVVPLNDRRV